MEQENLGNSTVASSRSKKYLIIGGVVVLIVVLGLISNFSSKKSGERIAENILEDEFGGEVDINANGDSVSFKSDKGTFTTGKMAEWPADMPSDVPEFTFGELTMSGTSLVDGSGWQVVASGATKADFISYHDLLKSNGWTDLGSFSGEIGVVQMQKGENNLMIAFNPEDSSFVLTFSVK